MQILQNILLVFEKFNAVLVKLFRYVLIVAVSAQILLIFATVVLRYFFNRPLSWSDELAAFLLVYITFFGCFVAANSNKLVRIEFVLNIMGPFKKYAQVLAKLASLALIGIVSFYGYIFLFSPIIQNQKSPAMMLPMSFFFWVTPVTMMFLFFSETILLIRILVPRDPDEEMPLKADKEKGEPLA